MATAAPDRCPSCHAERPANAPDGLCPRCLLRTGLDGDALSLSRAGEVGATIDLSGPYSVLETLAASVGTVPRVLLRDTDPGAESPLYRPATPEMPAPAGRAARLKLLGEIARGGMGAVLKGRDEDLGRDLAVKVLLEKHRDDPELVRRFVEEAQIGGQLQHPGIVPIYELGTFADRRPYFAMKLVKGQTLAGLLAGRPSLGEGLPRFLAIFEQVCQTVAYAHARGVIHRDLKPSNIMVGGFGEVQVMDWGLAKVLKHGGATDDARAGKTTEEETVIATVRSGGEPDVELSHAGSVLGTPAYMAPEQARGEIDRIDERADVFALGSILCEVLTGRPAFVGRNSGEIQLRAARGQTADALALLDACDADAELVGLARDCLAPEPRDRPRDAVALAARVTAYLSGVQERLRTAELRRAAESARAEEAQARLVVERSRRRRTVALAASMVALSTLGGISVTYLLQQHAARTAKAVRAFDEAWALKMSARDPADWRRVQEAVERVDPASLDPADRRTLAAVRTVAELELEYAPRDAGLRQDLIEIRVVVREAGLEATDDAYRRAFLAAGFDIDALTAADHSGRPIDPRRSGQALEGYAVFLHHWAAVRHAAGKRPEEWRPLLDVARRGLPEEFRDRIHALLQAEDLMAEAATFKAWAEATPPIFEFCSPKVLVLLLAEALGRRGDAATEVGLLEWAVARHPDDLWINFTLAEALERLDPPRYEEALRYYSVARVLCPEAAHNLAHLLERMGRGAEAGSVVRDLARRRPEFSRRRACLSHLLEQPDPPRDAAAVLARANPGSAR